MVIGVKRPSGSATLDILGVFGGYEDLPSRFPHLNISESIWSRERKPEEHDARISFKEVLIKGTRPEEVMAVRKERNWEMWGSGDDKRLQGPCRELKSSSSSAVFREEPSGTSTAMLYPLCVKERIATFLGTRRWVASPA